MLRKSLQVDGAGGPAAREAREVMVHELLQEDDAGGAMPREVVLRASLQVDVDHAMDHANEWTSAVTCTRTHTLAKAHACSLQEAILSHLTSKELANVAWTCRDFAWRVKSNRDLLRTLVIPAGKAATLTRCSTGMLVCVLHMLTARFRKNRTPVSIKCCLHHNPCARLQPLSRPAGVNPLAGGGDT